MNTNQNPKKIIQSYLIEHLPNGTILITFNKRDNRKIHIGIISLSILSFLSVLADFKDYWNDGLYLGIFFAVVVLLLIISLFWKFRLSIDKENKRIILNNKVLDNIKQIKVKMEALNRDSVGALEKWNIPTIVAVNKDGKETVLLMLDKYLKSNKNAVQQASSELAEFEDLFKDVF